VHLIWSNKNTTPVTKLQNFLQTISCTYRVPVQWFKTYSTLVQIYTYDLIFFTFSNSQALCVNSLYICYEHYNHKVIGSRLFDHRKPGAMPGSLCRMPGCFFFHVLLFFVTFFTTYNFVNYFLLLKGAR